MEITTIDSLRWDTGKRRKQDLLQVGMGMGHQGFLGDKCQGDKSLHGNLIGYIRRTHTEKE